MATNIQRDHIVKLCSWLVSQRSHIGYKQNRPMTTQPLYEIDLVTKFRSGQRILVDCSEFVTMVHRMAGLKDPNGYNYDGWGSSDTMAGRLKNYTDPTKALPGAIVVFGPIPGSFHVALVVAAGADPTICTHGSEQGPFQCKLSDYLKWEPQQAPATFLDVSAL